MTYKIAQDNFVEGLRYFQSQENNISKLDESYVKDFGNSLRIIIYQKIKKPISYIHHPNDLFDSNERVWGLNLLLTHNYIQIQSEVDRNQISDNFQRRMFWRLIQVKSLVQQNSLRDSLQKSINYSNEAWDQGNYFMYLEFKLLETEIYLMEGHTRIALKSFKSIKDLISRTNNDFISRYYRTGAEIHFSLAESQGSSQNSIACLKQELNDSLIYISLSLQYASLSLNFSVIEECLYMSLACKRLNSDFQDYEKIEALREKCFKIRNRVLDYVNNENFSPKKQNEITDLLSVGVISVKAFELLIKGVIN